MFRAIVKSLRIRHWLKNLLIFAPMVFARELFDFENFFLAVIVFGLFCALSSAIYIVNDISDREKDVLHPRKRFRPIASGELKVRAALICALVLLAISLLGALSIHRQLFFVFIVFIALQLLYSWKVRDVVILDVIFIATGFILRIYAGAVPLEIPVSRWLLSAVFLLALLLIFSKRYQEISVLESEAQNHRKSLSHYSPQLLSALVTISATATLVSYLLYTTDSETIMKFQTANLLYTSPFVFFGIFRFMYHMYQKALPDNPMEILFKDKYLLADVLLWILAVLVIIY